MNTPIIPENLLEVGNYRVVSAKDNVIIIDNWYKNFNEIRDHVKRMPLSRYNWKFSDGNFVDYYDCRTRIPFFYPNIDKLRVYFNNIKILVEDYNNTFIPEYERIKFDTGFLEFNFWKNVNIKLSNKFQQKPHIDSDNCNSYNCIVYFDDISSGGTAIYKDYDINLTENTNENTLMVDVSEYKKIIVESKPNRMAIFKSNVPHGSYINNHEAYTYDWRINQVLFFNF